MPTTRSTARSHQELWDEIVHDPALQDLPYSVETNCRGQLILSPHTAYHSRQQKAIQKRLDRLLPDGEAFSEYPIATAQGVKQADVIWASAERQTEMEATGDPPTRAPEIYVEVLSEANTQDEMQEKQRLYWDAGAEEVWIVDRDGSVRFFGDEERDQSALSPEFPAHVDV